MTSQPDTANTPFAPGVKHSDSVEVTGSFDITKRFYVLHVGVDAARRPEIELVVDNGEHDFVVGMSVAKGEPPRCYSNTDHASNVDSANPFEREILGSVLGKHLPAIERALIDACQEGTFTPSEVISIKDAILTRFNVFQTLSDGISPVL